jgi:arsenate reductase (glutaredoxin)
MHVTMYWYPKCGTCRSAAKWLESHGIIAEKVDLFETPPSAETLEELIVRSGLDVQKFFNVSGDVYREMNLKDKLPGMSREDKIRLLASNGRLIKRPIVTNGVSVTVGYKEADFAEIWGSDTAR